MTWLFEEKEGIEFESLPDKDKFKYATAQTKRKDKHRRWHDIWSSIAWSHDPNLLSSFQLGDVDTNGEFVQNVQEIDVPLFESQHLFVFGELMPNRFFDIEALKNQGFVKGLYKKLN